jgi:hypothetical protein
MKWQKIINERNEIMANIIINGENESVINEIMKINMAA